MNDSKQCLGYALSANMHSKVSINVVSVDVHVILRYSKPLMHVNKVKITNLDDLHVWNLKALELCCIIKTGLSDFRFLGSVITPTVVGAILL